MQIKFGIFSIATVAALCAILPVLGLSAPAATATSQIAQSSLSASAAARTLGASPSNGHAVTAKKYKNCTQLNAKYQHGVGKKGAKDSVRGSSKKVTNFRVDNALYAANKASDRDKDGIACEKR